MHDADDFRWILELIHNLSVQLEKEQKHMYVDVDLKLLNHIDDSRWKRV